jgi:hypothetical protein
VEPWLFNTFCVRHFSLRQWIINKMNNCFVVMNSTDSKSCVFILISSIFYKAHFAIELINYLWIVTHTEMVI